MMTEDIKRNLSELITKESLNDINKNIKKYPSDQKQSAVMDALRIVQEEHGYLTPELMNSVADYLEMPSIAVYEVATFYSMYELEPVGKNIIHVCRSISCHLRGADKIVSHLEKKLDVKCGHTTKDGQFSLKSAECLGACINAPMMQVNKTYHENLNEINLDEILEQYK